MFDQTFGVFNKFLGFAGIPPFPFFSNEKTALFSVFLMNSWAIGAGMILWLAAFRNIGKQYYEAAELDGAGALTKYRLLDKIVDGGVILGESNYSMLSSGAYNQALPLHVGQRNKFPSKADTSTDMAPAWNLHIRSANFLFKDGHVQNFKYNANNFNSDYKPNN
jgi:prepilin-type processing-associated H-X9-DG protein